MAERASVQAQVGVEEMVEGVVRLAGPRWVSVLEASGVNVGFQGDTEREATLAGFTGWLNSLSSDVQVLVRVLPVDMSSRVRELEQRARADLSGPLLDVQLAYLAFLDGLARERTLLERHFYIVVSVEPRHEIRSVYQVLRGLRRRVWPRRDDAATGMDADVHTRLTVRCDAMARELARCGVPARRLDDGELYDLWCACWQPERSQQQRRHREFRDYVDLVGGIGRQRHAADVA